MVGMLMSMMSSFKLFLFFEKAYLNSAGCETVIGIVLCYSHQACHFLHHLCEITSNSGIHIYLSDLNKNTGGSTDLAKK